MLARMHRLLLKVDLSEWFAMFMRCFYTSSCGILGYIYFIYSIVYYKIYSIVYLIYTAEKKENVLIILSAVEINRSFAIYYYVFFWTFRTPLYSEPGTPLKTIWICIKNQSKTYKRIVTSVSGLLKIRDKRES